MPLQLWVNGHKIAHKSRESVLGLASVLREIGWQVTDLSNELDLIIAFSPTYGEVTK